MNEKKKHNKITKWTKKYHVHADSLSFWTLVLLGNGMIEGTHLAKSNFNIAHFGGSHLIIKKERKEKTGAIYFEADAEKRSC